MICLSLPLRMYSYTRFTSSAFVFKPFPVSLRHFSQNFSSEFFNSSGFRPSREALRILFSVRGIAFESLELSDVLAIFSACGRACVVNNKRHNATLASFSCCSNQVSRGVRHYKSRVWLSLNKTFHNENRKGCVIWNQKFNNIYNLLLLLCAFHKMIMCTLQ